MGGAVWTFGDNIDTDILAPGAYMKGSLETLAQHCLESVNPEFARKVQPGDVVVAGSNFGMGSSREQAVQVLRLLGVSAVLAVSFAGIFYRNAFNLGLLALVCPDAATLKSGQRVRVDPQAGRVQVEDTGAVLACEAIPEHLAALVAAGGLIPYLQKTLGAQS